MEPVRIGDRLDGRGVERVAFEEVLREDAMSVGVYEIPAGADDPQDPHAEDEIYYVTAGRATIRIEDESYPVEAGDAVFVEREADHEFVDVEEDLVTLAVFAPAYGSLDDE